MYIFPHFIICITLWVKVSHWAMIGHVCNSIHCKQLIDEARMLEKRPRIILTSSECKAFVGGSSSGYFSLFITDIALLWQLI